MPDVSIMKEIINSIENEKDKIKPVCVNTFILHYYDVFRGISFNATYFIK